MYLEGSEAKDETLAQTVTVEIDKLKLQDGPIVLESPLKETLAKIVDSGESPDGKITKLNDFIELHRDKPRAVREARKLIKGFRE